MKFGTKAIHEGLDDDLSTGAIIKVTVDKRDIHIQFGTGRVIKYLPFESNKYFSENAPFIYEFEKGNNGVDWEMVFRNKHRVINGKKVK